MALGSFIGAGRSLDTAIQRAARAEELGYESVYVTHIAARDAVTTLMAYASRTERIMLGTGVMPIYSRTPVATAQSFATLDEFSHGRAVIGLGVSHRPVVEAWYGQTIDKPLRETREYVGIVRAILRGENPPAGEKFRSSFRFHGLRAAPAHPDLPRGSVGEDAARFRARSPTASCSGSATRTTSATSSCPTVRRDVRRRGCHSRASTSSRRCRRP